MSLIRLLYPALLFCAAIAPRAYAQEKEMGESYEMTKEGMNAKTDSFYFEGVKAKMKGDEPMAYRMFLKFSELRPEVADTWYELSRISYTDKKLDKAEEFIKKAVDLDTGNKWFRQKYAAIIGERGAFTDAAKIMEQLAASDPDDVNHLLAAAEYYERAKQYDKELACLDKAILLKGPDEDIINLKVQAYLGKNNVEKAADMVRELIKEDPRNGRYYRQLGDLYDNNKLSGKAAVVYENAEKIIPGDPYVQAGRAAHFLKIGDTAQYIVYSKKAILNNDLDAEYQMDLLSDLAHTVPNDSVLRVEGLPIMRQLVHLHPDDPQILTFFGEFLDLNNLRDSAAMAYSKSLRIKSSVEVWEKLLDNFLGRQLGDSLIKASEKFARSYPNLMQPHYYNAQGHFLKKEYPAAIKAINRAIDFQPEDNKVALANMYSFMAEIYHASHQDDFSDKAFDKAIELDPDNASTLNNYGYFLSERGKRLDDAERMSKKSLDLKPGEPTYLDTYGWILYHKGDYEKAKTFIKRAIELAGPLADGTLFDHLGDIYFRLNNRDKAVESWKLSKQKGVEDPQIDKKISEGKLYE